MKGRKKPVPRPRKGQRLSRSKNKHVQTKKQKKMIVFRLVDSEHDSVREGEFLTRPSSWSYQKIAEGMYFSLSKKDALIFAKKPHGHKYSHLLTCELIGVSDQDIVDLTRNENLITRWNRGRLPRRDAAVAFCREQNKKAILWRSQSSQESETWTELCLLTNHIPNTVRIITAEKLH